jgi:hypothetical protein
MGVSSGTNEAVDALFEKVKEANQIMEEGRLAISRGATMRRQAFKGLKDHMTVQQIADRLGLQRAAVYSALSKADE